jgi:Protein of unknown function (DUF3999)
MKFLSASFLLLALAVAADPEPSISYFTDLRDVSSGAADRQNYIIVDEDIWNHARPGLEDLRLYDSQTQLPYILVEQRARTSSAERQAKILNLGVVNGHTEFDLDVGEIAEYDRVRLQLDAKDFVVTASVEGRSTPVQGRSTLLGPSKLYDFSHENLGSSSVLRLPTSNFRFLHVRLSAGIRPQQVKGATIYNLQESKAAWTTAGICRVTGEKQRSTDIQCQAPTAVPIDRILLQVSAGQVNFRRTVSVTDAQGRPLASGEVSRIKVNRGGTTVISENLAVSVPAVGSGRITLRIDNGDDPPLKLDAVQPQSVERRLYFEPQGRTSLKLYYGDEKLSTPGYDYAKFFKADPTAVQARLGPDTHNPAYTGRPDDRPWSERHPVVLWAAMIVAVAILALLAIRALGMESRSSG